MFKDKKILFLSVRFHNYEVEILKKLQSLGAEVDFFDSRPSNSFISKVLIRINNSLVSRRINKYYDQVFASIAEKTYDYVFVIKAESVTSDIILRFKKAQPNAKFILYLYDSIRNNRQVKGLIPFFDKVLTFDKEDADLIDIAIFRPLFFLDDYCQEIKPVNTYDACFIGTVHSDRYMILRKIERQLKGRYKLFFYFYLPSKFYYYAKVFTDSSFRNTRADDFKYKSLPHTEVANIVLASKVVVDIQHPKQSGLTMRTFEVLAAKRKLITTNKSIKDYDLYNDLNVCVVDRKNPLIDERFLNSTFDEISPDILNRYSLHSFLIDVFS
jgi:hypothetical protein